MHHLLWQTLPSMGRKTKLPFLTCKKNQNDKNHTKSSGHYIFKIKNHYHRTLFIERNLLTLKSLFLLLKS
jgi:hypothetical protein